MREIKFRAWDRLKKRMIQPCYCEVFSDGLVAASEDDYYHNTSSKIELMQYTGLKDVNGKEIYEGDIFEWEYFDCDGKRYKEHSVVKWGGGRLWV